MNRKDFNVGYEKTDFYAVMGEFFAEEKYKKEMPYMKNSERREWSLFYKDGSLAGFYSHEEKKKCTSISSVYVLEDFRSSGVLTGMVKDMTRRFESISITSNSEVVLRVLRKNGFRELSARGSYKIMERKSQDGTADD